MTGIAPAIADGPPDARRPPGRDPRGGDGDPQRRVRPRDALRRGPQLRGGPARSGRRRHRRRGVVDGEQLAEQPAAGRQLGLGPDVDDPPRVEHGDPVGEGEGGAAVRDEQGRAPGRQRAQGVVDGGLGGAVDGRGGVVEHEDAGVGEHRAGQGDPLALPAGQGQTALADHRGVAVGQAFDELVHLRRLRRGADLVVGGVGAAVGDVGAHGVGEQERLLEHHAELAAQVGQPQVGQRHAAQAQLSVLRVVEAREQQRHRRLAGACGADERERLARRDGQRDPVEDGFLAGVAEPHAVELHRQRPVGQRRRNGRVGDVGLRVDQVVHPLDARTRELRAHDERPEQPRGPDEPGHVRREREEGAQRDRTGQRQVPAEPDDADLAERRQREQRRVEPRGEAGGAHALGVERAGAALQRPDLARLLPEPLHHADAGDGLLHLLRDVGRALLRRPRRREQRRPRPRGDEPGDRQQDQRDEREQRREPQHRRHRRDDEHHRPQRQRHHRQQRLHELQVGDRARHDLPGAHGVLALPVEALDRGEHLAAQVVLHVEREAPGQEPAQERRREPHQRQPGDRGHDGAEHGRGPGHGVVDGDARQERADRLQADAEGGCDERADRDAAVAQAGAGEPADPAGGGSVLGHRTTLRRGRDSRPAVAAWPPSRHVVA
ncbi:hypothetical protein GCM10017691_50320 [Pseudonocardia petroleophila]